MKLKTVAHSSYPRMGETQVHRSLRRALHLYDRKKMSREALESVYEETIKSVVFEQTQNDLDEITDGMVRWNDPISHVMRQFHGMTMGGLLRFFDTNFYFRQPIIQGPLARKTSSVISEAAFLKKCASDRAKTVLMGPYTLAKLSVNQTHCYKDTYALATAIATLLSEEVRELSALGVQTIQIEEPCYVTDPPEWEWARDLMATLVTQKGGACLGLVTYFGDARPIYRELQSLPVDFLGIDCTYSPGLIDKIQKEGSSKSLSLGVLDGRNTKLEDPSAVCAALKKLASPMKGHTLYVTTSCGLEYLPRDRAFDKLSLLKTIKHEYQKGF